MKFIRALTYTHYEVTGHTHTDANGRPIRFVRKQQPRWARNAVRVERPSTARVFDAATRYQKGAA